MAGHNSDCDSPAFEQRPRSARIQRRMRQISIESLDKEDTLTPQMLELPGLPEDTNGSGVSRSLTYEDIQRSTGMKVLSKLMDRQRHLEMVTSPEKLKFFPDPSNYGYQKKVPRKLEPLEGRRGSME